MKNILVLGPGCRNCEKLAERCREVIDKHQIDGTISKITDLNQITDMGITMTPGLIIDDKIVSSGRIPTEEQILSWLQKGE